MKKAVILLNLGGPDSLSSVKEFLFNLFYDPSIINLPNPLRWIVAKLFSISRTKKAQAIYEEIGGKSPIFENTKKQAHRLEKKLNLESKDEYKIFIAMRYFYPRMTDALEEVRKYQPNQVILLPLYPQFSTTTTKSSVQEYFALARDFAKNTKVVGCYPINDKFIEIHRKLLKEQLQDITNPREVVILFSAHGLPKKIIKLGDPYEWQINQTVEKIMQDTTLGDIEYKICYQSKVGPLEWIGPNTEDEIIKYSQQKRILVVVPVSFVSEHSETLVELDIEYKKLALKNGCKGYFRVKALGDDDLFVDCLKELCGGKNKPICPSGFNKCICRNY